MSAYYRLLQFLLRHFDPSRWKGVQDNLYKQEPWNLRCIPTIIRVHDVSV